MLQANRVYRRYSEVRDQIWSADQLLYRGRSIADFFIHIIGRSEYSHAAKAVWARGRLFVAETNAGVGCRLVTLSTQVADCPGMIDVYRTNWGKYYAYDREKAADAICSLTGLRYGWGAIIKSALSYLPFVRLFSKPDENDAEFSESEPPYCSAACSMADRIGGHDPVSNLADNETTPGDLARSDFYRYLFTLVPE